MDESRRHERVPCAVAVQYRTTGSFLVAYSVNLSRGGIFLETENLLPIGAEITLELGIHERGSFEIPARVSWRREHPDTDTYGPIGMGVEFDRVDETLGSVIDSIVTSFTGLTVLIFDEDEDSRAAIGRAVKSIISTAKVIAPDEMRPPEEQLTEEIDLVIVDTEASDGAGLLLLRAAKNRQRPIPAIALASSIDEDDRARDLGADEVVSNPPQFQQLQEVLLRALGRPASVQSGAERPA